METGSWSCSASKESSASQTEILSAIWLYVIWLFYYFLLMSAGSRSFFLSRKSGSQQDTWLPDFIDFFSSDLIQFGAGCKATRFPKRQEIVDKVTRCCHHDMENSSHFSTKRSTRQKRNVKVDRTSLLLFYLSDTTLAAWLLGCKFRKYLGHSRSIVWLRSVGSPARV